MFQIQTLCDRVQVKAYKNHRNLELRSMLLSEKHKSCIKSFQDERTRLPELQQSLIDSKARLEFLNDKQVKDLTGSEIDEKFEIKKTIADLEQQISKIQNHDDLMNYYLKTAKPLADHYKSSRSKSSIKISLNNIFNAPKTIGHELDDNHNKYIDEYHAAIDPNYIKEHSKKIGEEDFCYKCKKLRILCETDAKMICEGCGQEILIVMDSDKPSFKDPPPEKRNPEYHHAGHFNDWLSSIEGCETCELPPEVLDRIYIEMEKNGITNVLDLNYDTVKIYLKNNGFNKYYNNIYQIINRITGVPRVTLTDNMKQELKMMFSRLLEPFKRRSDMTSRHNLYSYPYIFFKLCQLLRYNELGSIFRLLKSNDKMYQYDTVWRDICEELGWEFIPSGW